MTRNNLEEHLSWLLNNTTLVKPPIPSHPPKLDSSDERPCSTANADADPIYPDRGVVSLLAQQPALSIDHSLLNQAPPDAASAQPPARGPAVEREMPDPNSAPKARSLPLSGKQNQLLTPLSTTRAGRYEQAYTAALGAKGTEDLAPRKIPILIDLAQIPQSPPLRDTL
jgi:hypothetical protein